MQNALEYISIENFKSIKNLKLEGLKRINLFIGKPNVGKSNILEALGILSLPYIKFNRSKNIDDYLRVETYRSLFFNGESNKEIKISCDNNIARIYFSNESNKDFIASGPFNTLNFEIRSNTYLSKLYIDLNPLKNLYKVNLKIDKKHQLNIKKYDFIINHDHKKNGNAFLNPPFGNNLQTIIEQFPQLNTELSKLFSEYGLKLVLDKSSFELKILKEASENEIFLIPFNSIADTLQRVIFYKTAIASNQNSTLIFEEPEVHAFPPYIVYITQEIIDSVSNQFVLSTHSPYILNYFLENAMDELAIFMVDYKNGETVANKLSEKDMKEILEYGIDLFTNYETFLK